MKRIALTALALLVVLLAAACGSTAKKTASAPKSGCKTDQLDLVTPGQLTVGTDNPAYPPWFGGGSPKGSVWKINDPSTGKGYESAVAYAIAQKLGFNRSMVKWVVVPFEQVFKPGKKSFDFDVNQVSVTPERAQSVGFSDSYYNVNQALVGIKGTPITKVKSIADLKGYKLGAQLGTTSYDYIVKNIKPDRQPSVYNTSNDVNSGLKARQIDGIVVDAPTAFIITGSGEVPNSVVVGQFPSIGGKEHFGAVFEKGSGLTRCVDKALVALKADGTLTRLEQEWLSAKADAPFLK